MRLFREHNSSTFNNQMLQEITMTDLDQQTLHWVSNMMANLDRHPYPKAQMTKNRQIQGVTEQMSRHTFHKFLRQTQNKSVFRRYVVNAFPNDFNARKSKTATGGFRKKLKSKSKNPLQATMLIKRVEEAESKPPVVNILATQNLAPSSVTTVNNVNKASTVEKQLTEFDAKQQLEESDSKTRKSISLNLNRLANNAPNNWNIISFNQLSGKIASDTTLQENSTSRIKTQEQTKRANVLVLPSKSKINISNNTPALPADAMRSEDKLPSMRKVITSYESQRKVVEPQAPESSHVPSKPASKYPEQRVRKQFINKLGLKASKTFYSPKSEALIQSFNLTEAIQHRKINAVDVKSRKQLRQKQLVHGQKKLETSDSKDDAKIRNVDLDNYIHINKNANETENTYSQPISSVLNNQKMVMSSSMNSKRGLGADIIHVMNQAISESQQQTYSSKSNLFGQHTEIFKSKEKLEEMKQVDSEEKARQFNEVILSKLQLAGQEEIEKMYQHPQNAVPFVGLLPPGVQRDYSKRVAGHGMGEVHESFDHLSSEQQVI